MQEGDLGVGALSLLAFVGAYGAGAAARAWSGVQKFGVGVSPAVGARGEFLARAEDPSMAKVIGMTIPKPNQKQKLAQRISRARRIKLLLIPMVR